MAAIAWLRSLGDVPSLVVGDLNATLQTMGIDGVLAMAGWSDLLEPAGVTCLPSNGNASRLDAVLANRAARARVVDARLRWDLGLATHAALQVTLEFADEEEVWARNP
eukprot:8734036-Lingulodinium_polyedra.AAC.1